MVAVVGPTAAGKTALSRGTRPGAATARWSTPTRCSSTAAWTSAPRSCARPSGRACRTTCSTCGTSPSRPAWREYQRLARAAIDDILARGRVPLLVGGSGLYVRAVLEQFEFPGTDAGAAGAAGGGAGRASGRLTLHARLAARDPAAAARILPSNGRRIVRALEVLELTGAPFARRAARAPRRTTRPSSIGVDRDPAALDERIARRVDGMWAAGLVDEVRALAQRGLRDGRTASRALATSRCCAHLDRRAGTRRNRRGPTRCAATRRFVRRQRSWFRRDPRIALARRGHRPT